MARQRGILNRRAADLLVSSIGGSGLFRATESSPSNYTFDVNGPAIHMQKSLGAFAGQGRLSFAPGVFYVPQYTTGIGAVPGSGYTVAEEGIYMVVGSVAVSGTAPQPIVFGGAVLLDGVAASGTETFAHGGVDAATIVQIHGIVNAYVGQVINLGVRRGLSGGLTTIGSEDMGHLAPAASMTIYKLPSDVLSFNA